jgi:hypothetical protein
VYGRQLLVAQILQQFPREAGHRKLLSYQRPAAVAAKLHRVHVVESGHLAGQGLKLRRGGQRPVQQKERWFHCVISVASRVKSRPSNVPDDIINRFACCQF